MRLATRDRRALVQGFAEKGNLEVVAAALDDPMGQCLENVNLDELRDCALRAAYPAKYDDLTAVDEVVKMLHSNLQQALSVIGRNKDQVAMRELQGK
jgi:hypothetical protein